MLTQTSDLTKTEQFVDGGPAYIAVQQEDMVFDTMGQVNGEVSGDKRFPFTRGRAGDQNRLGRLAGRRKQDLAPQSLE